MERSNTLRCARVWATVQSGTSRAITTLPIPRDHAAGPPFTGGRDFEPPAVHQPSFAIPGEGRRAAAIESLIPTSARPFPIRLHTLVGIAAAVPLLSALRSPAYPLGIRIGLGVLWLVSACRPGDALALLALVVPFGTAALVWLDAPPVRLTEALVVATLSGIWIRPARTSEGGSARCDLWSALLFCAVVVASLIVVLGGREIGVRSPWLETRNLALYLTHDYLVGPAPEFAGLADAALLLEGVALMWTVRRHARDCVPRVLGALIVAAVGAAALSLTQALASDAGSRGIVAGLLHARASGPVSDVNAIGSFFAMAATIAFGLAIAKRTLGSVRIAATLVAAIFIGGVWLSGSRMALVAAIAGATLLVVRARVADVRYRQWSAAAIAIAAILMLSAVTVGLDPRPSASRTASSSFGRRVDFIITGVRMIASAPVFGVGIGRYFEASGSFMPESIYWFYFHENAHNNFLQIGGELGLVGLAAFLWMLGVAARGLARAIAARPDDAAMVGSAAGAGVFAFTWLTSHPLLVAEVAYAFWIVLGAALARADATWSTATAAVRSRSGRSARLFAAAVALLMVSMPLRVRAAQPTQSLDRVSFGFYDWENDYGFPYRWTSRRGTFFIPSSARELDLPVRSMMILGHLDPVTLSVAVDGRVLDTFRITQGNWETVRLRLPPSTDAREFKRIDVMTDPAWTPAATGANPDVRVLGVQLGRPAVQ